MIERRAIHRFVRTLAKEFSPKRVVLFGSYARGNPSPDSDVDLLVIMRTSKRGAEQALEIRRRIARRFPLDLLVRTPREIARRVAMGDVFVTTILAEGKMLYESRGRR